MRAAYHDLARRLHPDRMLGASRAEQALAERRMREINEAWNVLREPVSRRRYDQARGVGRAAGPSGPSAAARSTPARTPMAATPTDDDDLVDVAPDLGPLASALMRHLPWVVLVAVFVLILVVTAYAGPGRGGGTAPAVTRPPVAGPGTCLNVTPGPHTTVVSCRGPHDVQVVARVDEATRCPAGTERRRLAADGLLDCVHNG
ncbi:MAG: hypothetical protein JWM05_3743 [Acidimicrobiales bacterium]|nr:hypothetical protein [Acidimicrobiales bacterium]